MRIRRVSPFTSRALAARRRAAAESGSLQVELQAARLDLERAPRWSWRRRRVLRAHVEALALLWTAYERGGRDMIEAQARVASGWAPPGVVLARPGGHRQ